MGPDDTCGSKFPRRLTPLIPSVVAPGGNLHCLYYMSSYIFFKLKMITSNFDLQFQYFERLILTWYLAVQLQIRSDFIFKRKIIN